MRKPVGWLVLLALLALPGGRGAAGQEGQPEKVVLHATVAIGADGAGYVQSVLHTPVPAEDAEECAGFLERLQLPAEWDPELRVRVERGRCVLMTRLHARDLAMLSEQLQRAFGNSQSLRLNLYERGEVFTLTGQVNNLYTEMLHSSAPRGQIVVHLIVPEYAAEDVRNCESCIRWRYPGRLSIFFPPSDGKTYDFGIGGARIGPSSEILARFQDNEGLPVEIERPGLYGPLEWLALFSLLVLAWMIIRRGQPVPASWRGRAVAALGTEFFSLPAWARRGGPHE